MQTDPLLDPDGKAAVETLVSHGFTPSSVADAMERLAVTRLHRARMDAAHRIAAERARVAVED